MFGFVRWVFGLGPPSQEEVGFGQSAADDVAFGRRFNQCRKIRVDWRRPTAEESQAFDDHPTIGPIIGRFGDDNLAVARIDGRQWLVRERMWGGYPDPPLFIFFAWDGDEIWAVRDFENWPCRWTWEGRRRPI